MDYEVCVKCCMPYADINNIPWCEDCKPKNIVIV